LIKLNQYSSTVAEQPNASPGLKNKISNLFNTVGDELTNEADNATARKQRNDNYNYTVEQRNKTAKKEKFKNDLFLAGNDINKISNNNLKELQNEFKSVAEKNFGIINFGFDDSNEVVFSDGRRSNPALQTAWLQFLDSPENKDKFIDFNEQSDILTKYAIDNNIPVDILNKSIDNLRATQKNNSVVTREDQKSKEISDNNRAAYLQKVAKQEETALKIQEENAKNAAKSAGFGLGNLSENVGTTKGFTIVNDALEATLKAYGDGEHGGDTTSRGSGEFQAGNDLRTYIHGITEKGLGELSASDIDPYVINSIFNHQERIDLY